MLNVTQILLLVVKEMLAVLIQAISTSLNFSRCNLSFHTRSNGIFKQDLLELLSEVLHGQVKLIYLTVYQL
jgi:hypothetical protein